MKRSLFLALFLTALISLPLPSSGETPLEDMVLIKAGCFKMGTGKTYFYEAGRENIREKPAHKVCLDEFYLDKYETSQKKFKKWTGYNPSDFPNDSHPAENVNWQKANDYCKLRGARLPTEAEWEYAARAGSQSENPWGDGIDGDYLWYEGNTVRKQHPVGTRKPNAWGVHDMMGGVFEWVSDWFSESYYAKSPVKNPQGPQKPQSFHVIRGTSWLDDESFIRITIRFPGLTDFTDQYLTGVRCAYTPKK